MSQMPNPDYLRMLQDFQKQGGVVGQNATKKLEEAQASAMAKISYKSEGGSKVNNKFTQDQIIQASTFIKSLLNK